MSINAVVLDENTRRPGRRPPTTWGRAATWGLAAGLVCLLAGDRGARTATPAGIDPLEVLNLQVRANAIIVLDSSGSMTETVGGNILSGDDPNSKLVQAKQVIETVVRANQTRISFQFGRYAQPSLTLIQGPASGGSGATTVQPANPSRFSYSTTSAVFPAMATGTELVVDLRSYVVNLGDQIIFREGSSSTDLTGVIPPKRYDTGTELAAAIETAMNSAAPLPNNRYTVTYLAIGTSHVFRIARSLGSATFNIRGGSMGSFGGEIGFTATTSSSTSSPCSTASPCVTGATAEGDIDVRRTTADTFTENSIEYYKTYARKYYNGARFNVLSTGIVCSIAPQTPGSNTAANPPHIELQLMTDCNTTSGSPVKFTLAGTGNRTRGGSWSGWSGANTCPGFVSLVGLAECTVDLQIDNILNPHLLPELRINADGTVDGYAEDADGNLSSQPTVNGIRAAGFTPIGESLVDIDTIFTNTLWPTIQTQTPRPRTFVIFVTDGDDTCDSETTTTFPPTDTQALRAARRAELLHDRVASLEPASSVTTYVVVFGSSAQTDRANWVAWGGSGMKADGTNGLGLVNVGSTAERWDSVPTAAKRAACTTCQDAFIAANAADLASAIQTAIDQGQSAGEFSDQQSITESVYEFVKTVPVPSPSAGASPVPSPDPLRFDNRYSASVPILLQSTFEMPQFKGHLNAFRNVNDAASPAWASTLTQSDAGQKLYDRLFASLGTSQWTFLQLRGGSTTTTDVNIGSSTLPAGTIRRRLYTTSRNGVFTAGRTDAQIVVDLQDNLDAPANGPGSFRVPIWPPTAAVDPAGSSNTSPLGILDDALGVGATPLPPPTGGAAPTALTFAQLQTQFGACTAQASGSVGDRLPPLCSDTSNDTSFPNPRPTRQLAHARKEARQIILAHAAGAALVTNNGLAVRTGASGCTYNGTTCGALQFSLRSWIMAESTLAAPAVVTPPLESGPSSGNAEYTLYRDGPRNGGLGVYAVTYGFGLRNPDKDDEDPAANRPTLKPVMSTVYHATNAALHAFRGGPCPLDSSNVPQCNNGTSYNGANEAGGEELWAFVPHEMLQNLKERMKPQARDPHTYMLASPVRFADVFVPGTFNRSVGSPATTVSGSGVWRLVILFGRGIGGKYYTALDVTAPGEFTRPSLNTRPPIPLWSRGNPDVHQGGSTPTANNNSVGSNTDATQYARMGQTWSVPAVGNVSAASNVTARRPGGVAYVAYTGSGFGSGTNAATEGSTFFTLDMLTGDVVASVDVGDRSGMGFENAIVAGPSAFNPSQLRPGFVGNSAANSVSRVYFPDIHGRIHRVLSSAPGVVETFADVGADQPIGNSLALLNYAGSGGTERPHVFAEAGNDNRITPPPADTPPFLMFGLRDEDLSGDPDGADSITGPARVLFTLEFPNKFRGTVQPATAFNDQSPPQGRVFFAGNRYNLPGTEFAPTPPPCVSSFDGILFAVGAETGDAAYDFTSTDQRSIQLTGQRVQAVRVAGGRLVVDTGLGADVAPPPPAPPTQLAPQPGPLADVSFGPNLVSATPQLIAQAPPSFKVGTSVCR